MRDFIKKTFERFFETRHGDFYPQTCPEYEERLLEEHVESKLYFDKDFCEAQFATPSATTPPLRRRAPSGRRCSAAARCRAAAGRCFEKTRFAIR